MRDTRRAALGALLAASFAAGCADTRVGPVMGGLDMPVLVGPVHRIGGGKAGLGRRVQTVEGEASQTIVSSSSTQDRGAYTVTTTTTSTETKDDVAFGIRTAAAGVPGCVATVRDLKAVQHYHVSLFAWGSRYVWVQTDIWSTGAGAGGAP